MTERKPITRAEKAAALRARAALLEQADKKAARAADTKRKVVLGGTVLAMMQDDAELRSRIVAKLREMTADRPADQRAVADLIGGDRTRAHGHGHRQDGPA